MARHLGDVTDKEWGVLMHDVVAWLQRMNVAGSIAQDYSLYTALDREREKAKTRQSMQDWIVERELDA